MPDESITPVETTPDPLEQIIADVLASSNQGDIGRAFRIATVAIEAGEIDGDALVDALEKLAPAGERVGPRDFNRLMAQFRDSQDVWEKACIAAALVGEVCATLPASPLIQ